MSDKKQSITFRDTKTTYPGPSTNPQRTSRTQDWNSEEEEESVDFARPVVHGTIKFREVPVLFPGSSPASESSTGSTQDTSPSTETLPPRVPPGFTEAHRGQANLYDQPVHRLPSVYSHSGARGISQVGTGPTLGPATPRQGQTPTDVYSSAASYMSRNNSRPSPIRTAGLNPVANDFTPRPSPMVSTTANKEPPRAPAAFSRLGQSGPLDPELARDKFYLDGRAEIHRRSVTRPTWGVQARVQVSTSETRSLAVQQSHGHVQVIQDEREHIDAVNDWYWAQATHDAPAPKPEPKK